MNNEGEAGWRLAQGLSAYTSLSENQNLDPRTSTRQLIKASDSDSKVFN